MIDHTSGTEHDEMERTRQLGMQQQAGAPAGARQQVRRDAADQGAVARPGGATQNSGGAIAGNEEERGNEPGRGAD
jgi:hypothetical protein